MDCNDCKYLSCTEVEQNHLKDVFGEVIPHICTKYNKRVMHRIQRRNHNPYLYPCEECERDRYKELVSHCEHCTNLDKCVDAMGDVIWTSNPQPPEDIDCEYFSEVCTASKEYIQSKIYKTLTKEMENKNEIN